MPGDDLKKTASDAADSVKQAAADAADKLNTAKEQARDYADRGMEYASDYWAARRVRAARTMDGDGWGFYGWLCDGSAAAERIAGLIVLLVPIMAEE